MDAKDLFLAQHAAVQSVAVGGNPASAAERAFAGLSDEQMRVRPREDLNSLAWLMWHIARAEDIMVGALIAGREQVCDDAWRKRLGVSRRDFGIGMTSPEVTEVTRAVDLVALREYRDAASSRLWPCRCSTTTRSTRTTSRASRCGWPAAAASRP